MDPRLRPKFNADFTQEKYAALLRCVNEGERWPADFRLSETPIFLTREFTVEVAHACAKDCRSNTHTGIRAPLRLCHPEGDGSS